MGDSSSSADDDLPMGGVEVDHDVAVVQQVRARAFGKLFGEAPPALRIGRFEVLREVGRGGMGVVHAAYDPQLQRNVALKVLRRAGRHGDARGQARLLREARAAARLSHPNVVTVYEVGEDDGAIHIAMELLDAVTLRAYVAGLRGDWRAIVGAYVAAGRGLAGAHAAGIVHRDFKPDNVLVVAADDARATRVCVTDFGLALAELEPVDGDASARDEATQGLVGTLPYMAPEQLRGEPATASSDQFGFCVALWEALHARRPFVGRTAGELLRAIESGAIEPGTSPAGIPTAVLALVRRGLASEPSARHPDMASLLRGLEREILPRSRAWLWPAIAAASIVGVVTFSLSTRAAPCTGAQAQLDAVWGPARRDGLTDALIATARPYAGDVARELQAQLEAYVAHWADAHVEACAATRIRGETSEAALDHKMACLGDRLARFDAAVSVLERSPSEVVESALAVSAALPSIAACTDPDARPSAITLPDDPAAAAEVQAQLAVLERGAALRRAGRPRASAEAIASQLGVAEALAHPPLLALVRVEQAETAAALADFDLATEALDEALLLAGRARELEVVALAAVAQAAAVVGAGDAAGARAVLHAARIAVATAGSPAAMDARLLQIDSRAAYARGEFDLALTSGLAALARTIADRGERSLEAAEALHVIAAAHHGRGDYRAAVVHNGRAREIREQLVGAHHPLVADSWANLGGSQVALGELDDALASFAAALEIRREALGDDHPAVADLLLNRGGIEAQRGELEAARVDFERALAILEARLGPDHPRVASALLNLAGVELERGDLVRAGALAERGRVLLTTLHGSQHPSLAVALGHLAEVARRSGDPERAADLLTSALELREAALGPRHPQLARTLESLATLEREQGRTAQAKAHALRALALVPDADPRREALQALLRAIDTPP